LSTILSALPSQETQWSDWKWQQRNSVRDSRQLSRYFPGCSQEMLDLIDQHVAKRRFQVTPYYLSLVGKDGLDRPDPNDPLWRQVMPVEAAEDHPYGYDGETENWELPEEMVTPIAQHKYDNRIIVRYANVCHAYCQFCYEALRTLDKDSTKVSFNQEYWQATLQFLRDHPEIEETIFSGGEPLMHTDEQLDGALGAVRAAREEMVLRLHTRALTFNPYRITPELTEVLGRRRVQAIGLHVTHPRELSDAFADAVRRLQSVVPILFANVPLLAGVNDGEDVIRELSMSLYRLGVHAGYLYHFMPHSPEFSVFRVPIQRGVEIVRSLRRHISNPAVPEYVLPHATGKFTVPLISDPDEYPRYDVDETGTRVLSFVNWTGRRVHYPDPE
jgi:lysine 2,3-aminomutase